MSVEYPLVPARLLACLKAPGDATEAPLVAGPDGYLATEDGQYRFDGVNGVHSLYADPPDNRQDVTKKVRSFYEENPFPNYEGIEEYGDLVRKGNRNPFSRSLLNAIGYNKLVLECGCGTGQLGQYLQLNNNHVLSIDMTLSSLRLANDYKRSQKLTRNAFIQMNIFNMGIRDESFDVAIAHGCLHHTFDARRAFAEVSRKVKPGGFVVVGLYNAYARIPTWIRARLIGLLGPKIDYVVRNRIQAQHKAHIWIQDQYYNPHETWHTIDEVLNWIHENDLEYINCVPAILDTHGENAGDLFDRTDPGTVYQRIVTQMGWLGTIAREGALFDVIARKPDR